VVFGQQVVGWQQVVVQHESQHECFRRRHSRRRSSNDGPSQQESQQVEQHELAAAGAGAGAAGAGAGAASAPAPQAVNSKNAAFTVVPPYRTGYSRWAALPRPPAPLPEGWPARPFPNPRWVLPFRFRDRPGSCGSPGKLLVHSATGERLL
jgi:hypothetical protein